MIFHTHYRSKKTGTAEAAHALFPFWGDFPHPPVRPKETFVEEEGWPEGIFSAPLTAFDATLTGSLGQRNGPGILGNPIPTKNFCAPPGLTGQPHNEAVSG